MSLYLKFLATTLTAFSLMGAAPSNEDLWGNNDRKQGVNVVKQDTPKTDDEYIDDITKKLSAAMKEACEIGPKPFVKKFRDGINAVFSDKSIDYVYGLYGNVCNTVPEWALWASAGFFVDSCTLGFFCDSHLGALAISSMLCYGSAKVSQLFGSNKAQDEVRSTLLSYCLDKMLGRNK